MREKSMRPLKLAGAALALAFAPAALAQAPSVETRPPITPYKPAFAGQTRAPEEKLNIAFEQVTVAEGLVNPWAIAFLPDGRLLVTEKGGSLRIVGKDGKLSAPVSGTPKVVTQGQGGLLDVALDPNFRSNRLVYLSFSEGQADNTNNTAVARARLVDGAEPRLDELKVIYSQRPSLASGLHFGSRLVFARDGKTLFVTQGERGIAAGQRQAQLMDGLIGKIVRINPDGSIPKDNPFVGKEGVRPEIWSYGHRNVQAAALHPQTGELWEVEYGPQGGDELNIARKGKDYGWPTISYGVNYGPAKAPITGGETQRPGMEQPLYYWDPVIAPSGMLWYTGSLFPAWKGSLFVSGQQPQGLPGGYIARLTVKGEKIAGEERLPLPPLRIRDIRQGPDGAIYVAVGGPAGKIVKLVPKKG